MSRAQNDWKGNISLKSTHRISHKLHNSVCMITKLTATGTQQTNIQNLIINQFCNMYSTSSTITNTTNSLPTHSTIITVLFGVSNCALFLEFKWGIAFKSRNNAKNNIWGTMSISPTHFRPDNIIWLPS